MKDYPGCLVDFVFTVIEVILGLYLFWEVLLYFAQGGTP